MSQKPNNEKIDLQNANYNTIEAPDLVNCTSEEIEEATKQNVDNPSIRKIWQAYKEGKISATTRDRLLIPYSDTMKAIRIFSRALIKVLGEPKNIYGYDTKKNKEIDCPNASTKVITPFVNTLLNYQYGVKNFMNLIIPKIKSIDRVLEKIFTEIEAEYQKARQKAFDRYFVDDDREAFGDVLYEKSDPSKDLNDILRATISCKYLQDAQKFANKFCHYNDPSFYLCPDENKEVRNRFIDTPLDENGKRYFDIKTIMRLKISPKKFMDVELQFKIDTLNKGDALTHEIYEKIRKIEAALETNTLSKEERQQKEVEKNVFYDQRIKINESFLHQYNMLVLEKISRMHDWHRINEDKPDTKDGRYKDCIEFLRKNYIPESYENFYGKSAFDDDSDRNKLCFLRFIGKLPDDFDMFGSKASKQINNEFSQLNLAERESFEGIYKMASLYKQTINKKTKIRINRDNYIKKKRIQKAKDKRQAEIAKQRQMLYANLHCRK